VLIQARRPSGTPLPVLSRGEVDLATDRDRGVVVEPGLVPPFPTIEGVVPQPRQPAARLGEPVRVTGHHLDGTAAVVRFAHRLLEQPNEVTIGTSTDPSGIDVTLPSGGTAAQDWPAGVYLVSVSVIRPGETRARESNVAAMLLAPEPQLPPSTISRDAATRRVTVTLGVLPDVRPGQEARLTVGGESALADPPATAASSLTFELGDVTPIQQWVRLTVDGVESLLVDRSGRTPAFDPSQSVTVPA
jgi:hypothetical protein